MNLVSQDVARSPRLLALLVAAVLAPATARAVVPVHYPPPVLNEVVVNDEPGDQTDPHVSGEWVVYSWNDVSVRYYNFTTGVDAQVPMGPSARDFLPDVSGSRITFSRAIVGVKAAIMVFDAATDGPAVEIDPASSSIRLESAIGGDTVAYVDYGLVEHGLDPRGEIVVHDLATSTSLRLTNDVDWDQNPRVSPAGDVVAWEHCTSTVACDVWQAVRAGGTWTVSATAASPDYERNPDSNGSLVFYDVFHASSPSHSDILWRALAGGPEVRLELDGNEFQPTAAAGFIAFMGQATLLDATDLFVYDVANNRLFQITDTPLVNEQLNDLSLLPDGRLRVVWASDDDGVDARNVRAATFTLPNVAPALSYPADSGYGTDGVDPDAGTPATPFTYKVVYTDFENAAPAFADVCIDGTCHGMNIDTTAEASLQDGNYTNGEQYAYATSLAAGPHAYFFEASDGEDPARLPAGVRSGPSVQGSAAQQITDLIALLESLHLSKPVTAVLEAALVIARWYVTHGDPAHACLWMRLFMLGVQLETGHAITAAQAGQLLAAANDVRAALGCP